MALQKDVSERWGDYLCKLENLRGTESTVNGVVSIVDTAQITTWYRPDIAANCRLLREDGKVYEVISEPENADMGNQFCTFKVERVKGGA